MAPTTRNSPLQNLEHVVCNIMGFPANGEVWKAIRDTGYVDLFSFLGMTEEDLDDITITSGDDTRKLNRIEKGKINAFQSFVIHRQHIGQPIPVYLSLN